jgi:hypothetical protein
LNGFNYGTYAKDHVLFRTLFVVIIYHGSIVICFAIDVLLFILIQ